ncbi:MAG: hypothetical protein EBY00_03920 [Actinobacteria bacterium]|nr:hypothetical protein [Actinomycetota bacterium]
MATDSFMDANLQDILGLVSQIVLSKVLDSNKSAAELFSYFSDFTTTNEWDPNKESFCKTCS